VQLPHRPDDFSGRAKRRGCLEQIPLLGKTIPMNRDDDSFLSAYLDGELDTKERTLVESGLVSDRELAEKLRGLTAVRDLVSSLNRDHTVDVKTQVMGRVRRARRGRSPSSARDLWLRAASLGPRAALAAGLAATVLLAVTLTLALPSLLQRQGAPASNSLARGGRAHSSLSPGPVADAERRQADNAKLAGARNSAAASDDAALESISRELAAGSHSGVGSQAVRVSGKGGTLEHFRQLLDNPRERRLFRIADSGDGKVREQVASVVESTTQFEFYQITIAQGIVIDPRHPQEATVYAALVSAKGLDALRDRLAKNVPGHIEESPADAAVVTQLADISEVRARESAPFGDVLIPPEGLLAFRVGDQPTPEQYRSEPIGSEIVRGFNAGAGQGPPMAHPRESKTPLPAKRAGEQDGPRNGPSRDADRRPRAGSAAVNRGREVHDDTFIVLVWVERASRG
jgi:hypothetical protein